jgi:ATP adenylyltransferase
MDHLWSPWRYRYITQAPVEGCVFCAKHRAADDREALILHRGRLAFVMLNLYPYTSGHLMVAPYEHVATLESCSEQAYTEMMLLGRRAESILRAEYKPDGLNIGFNIGASAGAGVAGHIHLHVVPRWTGDANFVSTIGETRVIPEDLADTYRRLKGHFELNV